MSTIHRIMPPISVVTPLGEGWAHFLIDYGHDWNSCWIVQIYETAQIKHFDSNDVRIRGNPTYATKEPSLFKPDNISGN